MSSDMPSLDDKGADDDVSLCMLPGPRVMIAEGGVVDKNEAFALM